MNSGTIILGLLNGLIISLLAVGFVLIYKANRFLNLAHAQLGVLSAMLLLKVVNDWGRDWWLSAIACVVVGIATGLVVVGDLIGEGSAQEQAVVGETPNLAARLQVLAAPANLVSGASTRQQIGELFNLKDLGPQQLAGFAELQSAWRVLGERRLGRGGSRAPDPAERGDSSGDSLWQSLRITRAESA